MTDVEETGSIGGNSFLDIKSASKVKRVSKGPYGSFSSTDSPVGSTRNVVRVFSFIGAY